MPEYLKNKDFESVLAEWQFLKRHVVRCRCAAEDLKETHDRRAAKGRPADDQFRVAQEDQRRADDAFRAAQEALVKCLYLLSENIVKYARFSGVEPDDAIQEGVLVALSKAERFNPLFRGASGQKPKAFNYVTTCILNHFRQLYRQANNYKSGRDRYGAFLKQQHGHQFDLLFSKQ